LSAIERYIGIELKARGGDRQREVDGIDGVSWTEFLVEARRLRRPEFPSCEEDFILTFSFRLATANERRDCD
jgi:hypothetical protein